MNINKSHNLSNIFRKYYRRKSLGKIFNIDYEEPFDDPRVMWGTNTAKKKYTITIPIDNNINIKESIKNIKEKMK